MLPVKSMQRYRLLITPVITTKPASSDLIIRAPVEKTIQVQTWLHMWSPPPRSLPWLIWRGRVRTSQNSPHSCPCSASFFWLPLPHAPPLHLASCFSPACREHPKLPAFFYSCQHVSLSLDSVVPFVWLILLFFDSMDLSSPSRDRTCVPPSPTHWKCRILTIGPPGKSLKFIYLFKWIKKFISHRKKIDSLILIKFLVKQ